MRASLPTAHANIIAIIKHRRQHHWSCSHQHHCRLLTPTSQHQVFLFLSVSGPVCDSLVYDFLLCLLMNRKYTRSPNLHWLAYVYIYIIYIYMYLYIYIWYIHIYIYIYIQTQTQTQTLNKQNVQGLDNKRTTQSRTQI